MTEKNYLPAVDNLNKIQKNFRDYQERSFPEREPQFFALELAGECGELANLEKKIWRDASRVVLQKNLPYEAADVFIALINYCNSRSIDLENAVKEKLIEIERRRLAGEMGKTQND